MSDLFPGMSWTVLMSDLFPGMSSYRLLLDVSVSPRKSNKHHILIRFFFIAPSFPRGIVNGIKTVV